MVSFRVSVAAVVLAVASMSVACGSPPPPAPAPKPAPAPAPAPAPTAKLPEAKPELPSDPSPLRISDDIRKLCGIDDNDAYFAFDSTSLRSQDIKPLNKVATCFIGGPGKGKVVNIVGHADPRGTTDYNMTLGQSRADAVGHYLGGKGLAAGQRPTTSRGSMDARGTDDKGWEKDRTVELNLAP